MGVESEINIGQGFDLDTAIEGLFNIGKIAIAVGLIVIITGYGISKMTKNPNQRT